MAAKKEGDGFSFPEPVRLLAFSGRKGRDVPLLARSFGRCSATPPVGGLALIFLTAGWFKNNGFQKLEAAPDEVQCVT